MFNGEPHKTRVDLTRENFVELVGDLKRGSFTGVVYVTTSGGDGFEEGALLLDNGKITGCYYEYFAADKKFYGDEALARVLNAGVAPNAVADALALKPEEVHAWLAEDAQLLHSVKDSELKTPKSYSTEYSSGSALKRGAFFKKFNLKHF